MLSFPQAAVIGRWAVKEFAEWARREGNKVEDVQGDLFFKALDVDLYLDNPWTGVKLVEVKGDRHTTGNIYVERVSNNAKGNPGCMVYTCADVVAYYLVALGEVLLIPVPELKRWMSEELHKYPEKIVGTRGREGDKLYDSTGHTVPIEVIKKEVNGTFHLKGLPVMGVTN